MNKLSCLIIEDEPLLAQVLEDYIGQTPFLELSGIMHDAISALEYLESHSVELIFIDINLPKLKGIEFIKMFQGAYKFIITTAYHEYALQGYELNVVDYLMKPIEFGRFLSAVKKAFVVIKKVQNEGTNIMRIEHKDFLYVNVNKKRVKINFSDITYIEGMKEYIKIHLNNDKWIVTKMQMNQVENILSDEFVRIHRSYIVAKKRVVFYNLTEVSVGGTAILPVGSNYKEFLTRLLE